MVDEGVISDSEIGGDVLRKRVIGAHAWLAIFICNLYYSCLQRESFHQMYHIGPFDSFADHFRIYSGKHEPIGPDQRLEEREYEMLERVVRLRAVPVGIFAREYAYIHA